MATFGHLAAVDPAALAAMSTWDVEQMSGFLSGVGSVDLDRAWNIVFRLVDELANPASMTVGATAVGGELRHGPAMCVDTASVKTISRALAGTSGSTVIDTYETLDIGEIYPDIFDDTELKVWALKAMVETARLFERAARADQAIVFAIL